MLDDDYKVIQYADDFCVYTNQNTRCECITKLQHVIPHVQDWLVHVGFSLSPSKSAVMFFSRHRLSATNTRGVGNLNIPVVDNYKYVHRCNTYLTKN